MMKEYTYDEALAFIHGAYSDGVKDGLNNMWQLLDLLGNPQRSLRTIHIAGTNGKGSACAFLQAILRCAGYRTGLYSSPFLQRYNERMRIDGIPIDDDTLARHASRVAQAAQTLHDQGVWPTEFEIGTALAFSFFAEEKPDFAIIEVGLGGRLDPTNVLHPLVSAIVTIALDHTHILGDTLQQIALEKAGIVKTGIPLVASACNEAEALAVIQAECARKHAPCIVAPPAEGYALGLCGAHQKGNAGVAVSIAALLSQREYTIPQDAISQGLRRAQWPARLELAPGTPAVLLDGAHNAQGADALADFMQTLPQGQRVLVFGTLLDKDWQSMVKALAPHFDIILTVAPQSPRAVDTRTLAGAFHAAQKPAEASPTLADAFARAKALAGPSGLVIIAGSLYLAGEARTLLSLPENTLLRAEIH